MLRDQRLLRDSPRQPRPSTSIAAAFAVGACYLVGAGMAWAEQASVTEPPGRHFPIAQIFTFLFLMLGPFKIIGPFSRLTQAADPGLARQIAVRAIVFSSLALLVAAFLGESFLNKYGIPLPILSLAAGIILFLVALHGILQQFVAPAPRGEAAELALTPLAFPTIVTPYGIATLIVFLAFSQNLQSKLTIGAILLAIMALNLAIMILARRLPTALSLALAVLGAVLGVIQVALGLQIINNSLRALLAV
jgi:multiple antibiotic resistance protein